MEFTFVFKTGTKSTLIKRECASILELADKVLAAAEHCDAVPGLSVLVWGPGMAARQVSHFLCDTIITKPWASLLAAFEQPIEEVPMPANF